MTRILRTVIASAVVSATLLTGFGGTAHAAGDSKDGCILRTYGPTMDANKVISAKVTVVCGTTRKFTYVIAELKKHRAGREDVTVARGTQREVTLKANVTYAFYARAACSKGGSGQYHSYGEIRATTWNTPLFDHTANKSFTC